MYTIATIQLHVQTLLDPSVACVIIRILEMEKRAFIPWQVNMLHPSCLAVQCWECSNSWRYSEAQYLLLYVTKGDLSNLISITKISSVEKYEIHFKIT